MVFPTPLGTITTKGYSTIVEKSYGSMQSNQRSLFNHSRISLWKWKFKCWGSFPKFSGANLMQATRTACGTVYKSTHHIRRLGSLWTPLLGMGSQQPSEFYIGLCFSHWIATRRTKRLGHSCTSHSMLCCWSSNQQSVFCTQRNPVSETVSRAPQAVKRLLCTREQTHTFHSTQRVRVADDVAVCCPHLWSCHHSEHCAGDSDSDVPQNQHCFSSPRKRVCGCHRQCQQPKRTILPGQEKPCTETLSFQCTDLSVSRRVPTKPWEKAQTQTSFWMNTHEDEDEFNNDKW